MKRRARNGAVGRGERGGGERRERERREADVAGAPEPEPESESESEPEPDHRANASAFSTPWRVTEAYRGTEVSSPRRDSRAHDERWWRWDLRSVYRFSFRLGKSKLTWPRRRFDSAALDFIRDSGGRCVGQSTAARRTVTDGCDAVRFAFTLRRRYKRDARHVLDVLDLAGLRCFARPSIYRELIVRGERYSCHARLFALPHTSLPLRSPSRRRRPFSRQ